ncbi:shikimate kinase [Gordonia otitidis]|uniref:Shikimate kinase n=1 Tax=Gordonia otitidis (strain DSM 44809 / CCUG 52243 / JCM 12355 / NBRC 100426 / IFM 10032) TaxID=1108044 RepID=H5TNV1_GORO1|nr:shikimate kinase [Gordonia otitidis NBRC 100426]
MSSTGVDVDTPAGRSVEPTASRPAAVLVGFMGAGKSTVGRLLADRLGVDFIDTDHEIVRRTGRSIPDIFVTDGADRFRELEAEVVADVLSTHTGIVALGGGAVTTRTVRDALDSHRVFYLKVSAESGFERVRESDRPLLASDDPAQRYRALLAEREETYSAVAGVDIDAHGDPDAVADLVILALAEELTAGRPS